jgi:flavin reductase (DIM6/NTAB) family NADH-FMN oxidoreductase RutF
MHYDAIRNDHGLPYDPIKAIVAPRPIGWVSTLNGSGGVNLAPYSFFSLVSCRPHYVMFASQGRKDSLRNAEREGEFVCSLATLELLDAVNKTGAALAPHEDEMDYAGLEKAPSRFVAPPRVARSPAALECRYHTTLELPGTDDEGGEPHHVVFGRVVGVYIDDAFIVDGRFRVERTGLLPRLGYYDYAVIDHLLGD